jgi:hypothetical protein
MRIAHHTWVWRPSRHVFFHKIIDDKITELFADIEDKMRETMVYGRCPGIIERIKVTATCFFFAATGTGIIPCFHRNTHNLVPLLLEHKGRDGAVDTPAHCHHNLSMPAHPDLLSGQRYEMTEKLEAASRQSPVASLQSPVASRQSPVRIYEIVIEITGANTRFWWKKIV